jgi:penicillin-binding protein 2
VIALAASAAVVIAVGAIALLAHGRGSAGGHPGAGGGAAGSRARGQIQWGNGDPLATNRASHQVQIDVAKLPAGGSARSAVYRRLTVILGVSARATGCRITGHGVQHLTPLPCEVAQRHAGAPHQPVIVARRVPRRAVEQIADQASGLPGVSLRTITTRVYPNGSLAAQVLGTVGPLPAQDGSRSPDTSTQPLVGRSGLEAEYDRLLTAGDTLKTSLDERLQQAGQRALQHAITLNRPASSGAFVALDPQNGAVYAMGSLPSYDPNSLIAGPSRAVHDRLTSQAGNEPLLNRVIDSAGPTGSTFKPITALGALGSREWSIGQTYDDTGRFCLGNQCRRNAGGAANGALDLVDAFKVASDTFFENLGARMNVSPHPQGGPLQTWAGAFGIGRKTGVDLPGELSGTLPSPAWRAQRNTQESQCEHAAGPFTGHPKHVSCGIADGRPWSVGDNLSLAVGQGDLRVTPLQLAVVYSALANGGTIVRPHIGLDVANASGTVLQKVDPPPTRRMSIGPTSLKTVRAGLRAAASKPGGTSADVFGRFPEPVYGQAGTAERNDQADDAWYACFVPASATTKPIVVVVTVAQGGFGSVSAAPVAREILSQWFNGRPGVYVAGTSNTL